MPQSREAGKYSEEVHDNQRKNITTGLIGISSLSNNRVKQSNQRLAWIMFHKIAHMYWDIRKYKTVQASLLIQGLHVNFKSTKAAGTSHAKTNLYIPLKPTMPLDPTTVT